MDDKLTCSIFTKLLKELSKYSYEIDCCIINTNHFVDIQRLKDRIIRAHNVGYNNDKEKRSLFEIANILHEEYCDILRLL